MCGEMGAGKERPMMTIQPIIYALSLFLALASLLRWTYLREDKTPHRVRRSMRTYFNLSGTPHLEIA
jgi:hypothetical protein